MINLASWCVKGNFNYSFPMNGYGFKVEPPKESLITILSKLFKDYETRS